MLSCRRWLLPVLLVFASVLLAACDGAGPPAPRAVAGHLDLRNWDFGRQGVVPLDGQWLLEWDEFADPRLPASGQPIAVPGPWNEVSAQRYGRATYRLTVDCQRGTGLSLHLPVQHSAARWFVNGALVARQGEPGASPRGAQAGAVQQSVALGGVACPLQIVAHVSNFDMQRGGLLRSVELGDVAQLAARREAALMRDLLTVGGLIVLGALPVMFWFGRRSDRSPLYFGLLCLTFALGMALTGTRVLQQVVEPLGWSRYQQVVFICWYLTPVLFTLFVRSLYPQQVSLLAVRMIMAWVGVSSLVVVATSSSFFTRLAPMLTAGSAAIAGYLVWRLVLARLNGRRTAPLLLFGLLALSAAVVHDVVNYAYLARSSMLPYGVLLFVAAPAYLMARRFARALLLEERMGIEQRERANLLVRSTNAGLLDWDAIGNRTTYSERYREMLGYSTGPDAPELPPFQEQVHPEDRDRIHSSFLRQLRDRSVVNGVRPGDSADYRLRRVDGEYLWVHAEAVAVCGRDGRTLRYICSFIDISDRMRHDAEMLAQQQALQAQVELTRTEQRRLDLVVRAARVGIVDWDGRTHETWYSPHFRAIRGYAPDADTAGWPDYFKVMIHPDDRERITKRWISFIRGQGPEGPHGEYYSPEEYRLLRADGSYVWVQVSGVAVRDERGFTMRWIAAIIDITQRRAQEEALRDSHAQIADRMKFVNDLVDALPLALSMRNAEGRLVFANRTWERYYAQRREEVIGKTARETFTAEEAATFEALDAAALARAPGEPIYTAETPFRGHEYTQLRTLMLDGREQPVGVLTATEDVTERRRTERALATEQKRIELVVRAAKAGIVDYDAVKRTGYYSPRLREIMGHPPDADTSSWPDYFDLIHPDDRGRVATEFRNHIIVKRAPGAMAYHDRIDYRLKRADGSWVWVQGMGVSITNDKGQTGQFIASITDISERRAQEEALRASNEALKENVRLREEVERIGRHDIKTPLNSIVAVPRLLREERRLGPEADELLGIVERAGYRILSMVNLSLDLYKMEQGSYIFRPDAVDLSDLVDKVLADVKVHAASKGVRFDVDLAGAPYAWAEELLCYSLLANLTKNAVEASPEGELVSIRAEAGEGATVLLHVRNRGAVPQAIRGSFFQKYATLGKASGTGLGTYSARLMARVQDGDIAMRTSDEDGTTLTVTLRAAPEGVIPASVRHASERDVAEPLQITTLPPTRVLLVDDDEYNLLIVRRFLPAPPFTVETAINGRMALGVAERRWPDVIFMDLDMPVMGGLQAVAELRTMERDAGKKRCTMIALSSHEDEATRESALAAGFDRYLTKPVTRTVIHETLLQFARRGAAGAPQPSTAPVPSSSGVADPIVVDADMEPMMGEYLQSRHALIEGMATTLAAGEREELRRLAHQLAGSFGLYGFRWASEQCRWIEKNFADVDAARLEAVAGELHAHLERADIQFVGME
ncbi:MAG TPA: PAS domain-containing protein [Ramlibacter sp.]|jgi:PAS domain S-box-containing protein|nr:PAS domain-containing protein [Ramlibacter sp.]